MFELTFEGQGNGLCSWFRFSENGLFIFDLGYSSKFGKSNLKSLLKYQPALLICISHFHKDHIGGLKQTFDLLKKKHPSNKVFFFIPYLDLADRIINIYSLSASNINNETLAFVADPEFTLSRGEINAQVIYIRGNYNTEGGPESGDLPPDEPLGVTGNKPSFNREKGDEESAVIEDIIGNDYRKTPAGKVIDKRKRCKLEEAESACFSYAEIPVYVKTYKPLKANIRLWSLGRSHAGILKKACDFLDQLEKEIRKDNAGFNLTPRDLAKILLDDPDFAKKLRGVVYQILDGLGLGKIEEENRNNLIMALDYPSSHRGSRVYCIAIGEYHLILLQNGRPIKVIFTGDGCLNDSVFYREFDSFSRLNESAVNVYQVQHHGSKHNHHLNIPIKLAKNPSLAIIPADPKRTSPPDDCAINDYFRNCKLTLFTDPNGIGLSEI